MLSHDAEATTLVYEGSDRKKSQCHPSSLHANSCVTAAVSISFEPSLPVLHFPVCPGLHGVTPVKSVFSYKEPK
jgi:hypothetical protein